MTYEQNVRAILESNFAGFKDEIIDIACERICELTNPYDRVLKIIDSMIDSDEFHNHNENAVCRQMKKRVSALNESFSCGDICGRRNRSGR